MSEYMADTANTNLDVGDPAAFMELYTAWSETVGRWTRRRLWDPAEAEDAAQEVFLRAWTCAARFDPQRGAVGSWLYGITRNVCADRLRRAGRARAFVPPQPPAEAGTDELAERALDAGIARAAVSCLPQPHREVIELCFFQELTHTEAAARLGIPIGTVKSRSHHALRRLRQTMLAS